MKTVNIAIVASVLAFTMVSPGHASEDDLKSRGLPAQDYSNILIGGLGEQNNPRLEYTLELPNPHDYSNILIGGQNPRGGDYYMIGEEHSTQRQVDLDLLQGIRSLQDRVAADEAKINKLEDEVKSVSSAKK